MIAMDYVTAAQCIAHFKHNHKALYQQRLCRLLQIKECYAVGPQIDDVFTRRHMQEEKPQAIWVLLSVDGAVAAENFLEFT